MTVTVKLQLVVVPQESVAVQVTVLVPMGKVLPLRGLQVTIGGEHPPVAKQLKKTVAPFGLAAETVRLEEQMSVIGVWTTVTWNEQLAELPQVSLAVQVTVLVPIGKVLPLGGLAVMVRLVQPPLAVLLKKTVAPLALVA